MTAFKVNLERTFNITEMKKAATFLKISLIVFFATAILAIGLKSETGNALLAIEDFVLLTAIFASIQEDERKLKLAREETQAKVLKEERKRMEKVEAMSEAEFISFIKNNRHLQYDENLKIETVRSRNGIKTKIWSTTKYKIVSEKNTKEEYEFVSVVRQADDEIIFSGCW